MRPYPKRMYEEKCRRSGSRLWPYVPLRRSVRQTLAARSRENHFKALHPCPANGKARGACPGYVIDHVTPLACGGADDPSNMQWQTTAEGRAKDKWERRGCSSDAHEALNRVRGEANADEGEYLAHEIHTGPRGGRYYLTRSGSKRYIGAFKR
jgi:hypothetical protein